MIYEVAVKYAIGFIARFKIVLDGRDVVHDIIADGVELSEENYKQLIRNKVGAIRSIARGLTEDGNRASIYFTCTNCKENLPDGERYSHNVRGIRVYRNMCKTCYRERSREYSKRQTEFRTEAHLRRLERSKLSHAKKKAEKNNAPMGYVPPPIVEKPTGIVTSTIHPMSYGELSEFWGMRENGYSLYELTVYFRLTERQAMLAYEAANFLWGTKPRYPSRKTSTGVNANWRSQQNQKWANMGSPSSAKNVIPAQVLNLKPEKTEPFIRPKADHTNRNYSKELMEA